MECAQPLGMLHETYKRCRERQWQDESSIIDFRLSQAAHARLGDSRARISKERQEVKVNANEGSVLLATRKCVKEESSRGEEEEEGGIGWEDGRWWDADLTVVMSRAAVGSGSF